MGLLNLKLLQLVRRAWLPRVGLLAVTAVALLSPAAAPAQTASKLKAGAAIRDVTPGFDMLPVAWNNSRIILDGVMDPLHVRVLALSDGEATALIISTETGRGPFGPQFANLVAEHTGLPVEAILYTATHAHAAPEFSRGPANLHAGPADEVSPAERWAIVAAGRMLDAVDEALADMRPATVGLARGASYVNFNRLATYHRETDGQKEAYPAEGYNPTGVSDKDLYVLEFRDAEDVPIAFVVNYAVHGVVMFGNTLGPNGASAVSSDISGYASTQLEKAHPGAVALWLSGAAGDQDPIVSNHLMSPDPATGEFAESFTGNYELLKYVGNIHYEDIRRTLAGIDKFSANVAIRYGYAGTTIPAKDGGQFPIGLQLLRIGDIALMGFSGELFSQLGLDIKSASPLPNTMVVTHARQREEQNPGYHADDASADRAFNGNTSYAPGHISRALTDLTRQLLAD